MTDKIRVIISNSQKEVKIPTGLRMLVRRCCNAVLRMENFQGAAEVSVTFANNEQIHELNKMHRNVDAPTDEMCIRDSRSSIYQPQIQHAAALGTGGKKLLYNSCFADRK